MDRVGFNVRKYIFLMMVGEAGGIGWGKYRVVGSVVGRGGGKSVAAVSTPDSILIVSI